MDSYEQHILRTFAINVLNGDQSIRQRAPRGAVAHFLYNHYELLGLSPPEVDEDDIDEHANFVRKETWAAFRPLINELRLTGSPPKTSDLECRLSWICETLNLQPIEGDILKAAVRVALHLPFERLANAVNGAGARGETNVNGLSSLTGHGRHAIVRHLSSSRPLTALGLLEDRLGGDYAPSGTVLRIARHDSPEPTSLREMLTGKPRKASLTWKDFAHLDTEIETVAQLIASALANRAEGVNVLLHGDPGTGKTEFVRTLAKRLKVHAAFVGETDDDNGEPSRPERLSALALSRSVASRAGDILLAVDEADDIFAGVDDAAGKKVGSKVFMHRLVEGATAPTIWITNHPDRLGPAVLRRMSLAVRFPTPSRAVRQRLIERIVRRHRLKISKAGIERLAGMEASPAVFDNAIKVAKLTQGAEQTAEAAARSVLDLLNGPSPPPPIRSPMAFDPLLSSADQDLVALADRLTTVREMAFSMCLHGIPGTGKSAFARYVAQRMGIEVVEKRASDVLSMWVGATEKKIAQSFQEAADRKAMLIFDEADSLLRDRAEARASWQVSQVNEMLTWMERHPYPVVCTTNLMDSLDPATLRRFVFKVRFLAMTPSQIDLAFTRMFSRKAPRKVLDLDPLAPGDFALVGRQARLMGIDDATALADMLAAEVAIKPGAGQARIGF